MLPGSRGVPVKPVRGATGRKAVQGDGAGRAAASEGTQLQDGAELHTGLTVDPIPGQDLLSQTLA